MTESTTSTLYESVPMDTQDVHGLSSGGQYVRVDDLERSPFDAISQPLLLCGDACSALELLPSGSVQTALTSPPYWSLRDYGVEEQIGRDDSLEAYVQSIVAAFEQVKRVLRDDGTVWLNVGDSYTSGNRRYRAPDRKNPARAMHVRPPTPEGLKPKELIGVPWRLAFALQDAGWWVRGEVIWTKPNAHPESVRDRPTRAHETVFLLSKKKDYYYNIDAVRGPRGRRLRTVWEIPTEPVRRLNGHADDHPAMMPLSLARRCLAITSRPGSVVLDPYAGSGTTLLAAQELGRKWVGVEIKPEFADLIERKDGQHVATLDDLKARLDTLSPVKIEFVAQVVESLSRSPGAEIRSHGTWLTASGDWTEYFGLALSVHHAATTVPLGLGSFESVFRNACEHVHWPMEPPESATQRFVDLVVYPTNQPFRRLSLKSTAAKRLSTSHLHISKLTEAAWIQDVRTPRDRRERTLQLFRDYQAQVSHIVMLRAFREAVDTAPSLYQLVEIPTSIFDSIQGASLSNFDSDAPSIPCRVNGEVVAVAALDRSDAKITVRRIRIDACTVHAEWKQV